MNKITIDIQQIELINNIASELRQEMELNNNYDLYETLEYSGIDIKIFEKNNYDSYLRFDKDKDKPVIAFNANNSDSRNLFSVAHELGHLVLDYKWLPGLENEKIKNSSSTELLSVTMYRGGDYYSEEENEREYRANEFASAFLMPLQEIKDIYKNNNGKFTPSVKEICTTYNVSPDIANIRLKNIINKYTRFKGVNNE